MTQLFTAFIVVCLLDRRFDIVVNRDAPLRKLIVVCHISREGLRRFNQWKQLPLAFDNDPIVYV